MSNYLSVRMFVFLGIKYEFCFQFVWLFSLNLINWIILHVLVFHLQVIAFINFTIKFTLLTILNKYLIFINIHNLIFCNTNNNNNNNNYYCYYYYYIIIIIIITIKIMMITIIIIVIIIKK